MRIAQIASVIQCVPPEKYAGAEQVVFDLTNELVRRGHDVTLFASGDSITNAKLISVFEKPVSKLPFYNSSERFVYLSLNAAQAFEKSKDFDIIHNHTEESGLIFSRFTKTPVINTHHGMFLQTAKVVYQQYLKDAYFVAISNAQKSWFPELNFIETVYHGIDIKKFPFNPKPKDYFLFLSKIWPAKGPHIAIAVAKKTKKKLIIAGYVSKTWESYFKNEIKPHIDGKNIIYLGEINFQQKIGLYKNARALLFPINWQEAFGLVMIEAMACGTPVIAFNCASVPEIVLHNKTGFIVNNIKEMEEAVGKIDQINRRDCRKHTEENFIVQKMTSGYEKIYQRVIYLKRSKF